MTKSNIRKRDGVIIIKHVKPYKKKTVKKMDTISAVPLDTVENAKKES